MSTKKKLTPLDKYKKAKIDFLEDFYIFMNESQIRHMKSLESEIAVDNYALTLISNKL